MGNNNFVHNRTTNTYTLVILGIIIISANGDGTSGNVSRSMPSSPGDKNSQPQPSIPVVGSAENLVGRVSLLYLVNLLLFKAENKILIYMEIS